MSEAMATITGMRVLTRRAGGYCQLGKLRRMIRDGQTMDLRTPDGAWARITAVVPHIAGRKTPEGHHWIMDTESVAYLAAGTQDVWCRVAPESTRAEQ